MDREQDIQGIRQQRQRDSLRFAQAKLQNLEETLKNLRLMKDRLIQYREIDAELQIHSQRMFQLTKESATLSATASEMERFETFENIIVPFLRMQMLDTEAEEYRRTGQEVQERIHDSEKRQEELRKQLAECLDTEHQAIERHRELCTILERCNILDGKCDSLGISIKQTQARIRQANDNITAIREQIQDVRREQETEEARLEVLKNDRHSLESHENMLEHAELVLSHLKRLRELQRKTDRLREDRNESTREQSLQNEILGRIYNQYNDLNQQIQTLQDEVGVHRTNIRGMVSFDVQERVLKLKSRSQMLISAKSLWRRISSGYQRIEEKTRLLNSLRLDIEHDLKAEQELTTKVAVLARQVHEKEYALNMSKSQNVVQLRADLTEGEACTVCGATHHPFHSDTMLDQSKLISDIRGDYETLNGELTGQKRQLEELHDRLTKALGRQIAEQQNLDVILLRQEEDVKEWEVYAELDPTFRECSQSTDSEARMATLRQLLDNTQRDVQSAETELSDFIYHTTQIDVISEKIANLDEKKDETITRMGEVNTACQVLASQVEGIDGRYKTAQDRQRQLYNLICTEITLPDWYSNWQSSHDNISTQITEMSSQWNRLRHQIPIQEKQVELLNGRQQVLMKEEKKRVEELEELENDMQSLADKQNTCQRERENLLGRESTAHVLEQSTTNVTDAQKHLSKVQEELHQIMLYRSGLQGELDAVRNAGAQLDEKARTQRSAVDLWIHAYNASHPPVQYSELSELLTKDIDWNQKRQTIRQNQMETQLEQQTLRMLQARIVTLEVDTGALSDQQVQDRILHTDIQIEETESSIRSIMLQIARLQIELGIPEKL